MRAELRIAPALGDGGRVGAELQVVCDWCGWRLRGPLRDTALLQRMGELHMERAHSLPHVLAHEIWPRPGVPVV